MWLLKLWEIASDDSMVFLGIAPRDWHTLPGIITAFFIHGDMWHILSNTTSFIVLSLMLVYAFPRIAFSLFVIITVITGALVWAFARGDTYHIGASGTIYGFAGFLFLTGFLRKDKLSMVFTAIVVLFYGGFIWGVLPFQKGISWESHLFGMITGLFLAYVLKDYNKISEPPSESEELEDDRSFGKFLEEEDVG